MLGPSEACGRIAAGMGPAAEVWARQTEVRPERAREPENRSWLGASYRNVDIRLDHRPVAEEVVDEVDIARVVDARLGSEM